MNCQKDKQNKENNNIGGNGMYRLKEYLVHDTSNRGNNYRGIVMTIHHKEDIGNNCYSTLCIYYMKFKFYP